MPASSEGEPELANLKYDATCRMGAVLAPILILEATGSQVCRALVQSLAA